MIIKKLILGVLDTNCYILFKDNNAIIIDPADNYKFIIDSCNKLNVIGILVTHHHPDHICALKYLEDYYNLKHNNFDNSIFKYKVLKTPGHTDDSISFYFEEEKVLFSGDFIFNGSIGRFDFENSNEEDMKKSLDFISTLPDDIIVYPGHGEKTILGKEKRHFKDYF